MNCIELYGVSQNNLKNINLKIPLGKFVAICGPSGSGKSSLAFETLYAEGQRRFIESMSIYVRQFLDKAEKPKLLNIKNIPPAISLEQTNKVKTYRSTLSTITELLDYIRLCFVKVGIPICPTHKVKIEKISSQKACELVINKMEGERVYVLVPVLPFDNQMNLRGSREHLVGLLCQLGFTKAYLGNKIVPISKDIKNERFDIVMDRLQVSKKEINRLTDSITNSYSTYRDINKKTGGVVRIISNSGKELKFSQTPNCYKCDFLMPEINHQFFNFLSPYGACNQCEGAGQILAIDKKKIIPNENLSIKDYAIHPFKNSEYKKLIIFCEKNKIDIIKPWKLLSQKDQNKIFDGDKNFVGIDKYFLEKYSWKYGEYKYIIHRYQSYIDCPKCGGTRLRNETSNIKINNKNIHEICKLSVLDAFDFFNTLELSKMNMDIIKEPLSQIISRLEYLIEVGVGYLTLDRTTRTLSGGEYQRVKLATQLGLKLSQTMYVLDEPTIGLHPKDNFKLIKVLKKLKKLNNTLIVVEHDLDVIKNSDHVVEMGPCSGSNGGEVIYSGKTTSYLETAPTEVSKYLKKRNPKKSKIIQFKDFLLIKGCCGHNLKNIDIKIPLNSFVTVTGVSGSGKSSLINQTIFPALKEKLCEQPSSKLDFEKIDGFSKLDDVLMVDQDTVGRTLRSIPATYVGIFDDIRKLMSNLEYSKKNFLTTSNFSMNVEGGRCDVCEGTGIEIIDMAFMDDVKIICEKCNGKRFKKKVLNARLKGKNINDILNLSVDQAFYFFKCQKSITNTLMTLKKVGLGYIKIGQPTQTLSGGESQRLKISKELSKTKKAKTIYFLDEPTVGLHPKEIKMLLDVINKIILAGGTVVAIEHNLDFIAASDYIIELGPGGGELGGSLLYQGRTKDILDVTKSQTAPYLKSYII